MNKKLDRGQETREQLVAIATRLFTDRGYEGTSIEAVLAEAAVSRGALYHHYNGKEALFTSVLHGVYDRIDNQLRQAARRETDALSALQAGCLVWVRLAVDPAVRRILLIDAPSVLGWQCWRELDESRTLGLVRTALTAASKQGLLAADHVDFFAHALLASMNEIAMMIAQSEDPAESQKRAETAVEDLLQRLLTPRAS
jgi:AcrR family transcriptional regulator